MASSEGTRRFQIALTLAASRARIACCMAGKSAPSASASFHAFATSWKIAGRSVSVRAKCFLPASSITVLGVTGDSGLGKGSVSTPAVSR